MAGFPGGAVERAAGVEAIGGRAELVDGEQREALRGERETGDAVGEGAVAVEVAAGGEVSGERRGALPHFAAAAGEAIVGGGELLVADDPETLGEEDEEEKRGETLRPSDLDARKCHAATSVCKFSILLAGSLSSVSRRVWWK